MVPHVFACQVLMALVNQELIFIDRGEQANAVSYGYFEKF